MNNTAIDKNNFISTASDFFNEIFEPAFNSGCGSIEIRTFPKGQAPQQYFFESETEAAEKAYQLCQQGGRQHRSIDQELWQIGLSKTRLH